jgi:hypothetical protein
MATIVTNLIRWKFQHHAAFRKIYKNLISSFLSAIVCKPSPYRGSYIPTRRWIRL